MQKTSELPQLQFANLFEAHGDSTGAVLGSGTLDADSGGALRTVQTVQVAAGDSAYGGVYGVVAVVKGSFAAGSGIFSDSPERR